MPRTATLFLIGSVAIVGLPPLNGFVSEWLIFRGLLNGGVAEGALRVASVMVVGLALTSGLALACFSKLYGVVFLGTPRDPAVSPGHPEERRLHPPQLVLAASCMVIGVAPAVLLPAALGTAMHSFPGGLWDAAPTELGSFALSTMSGALLVLAGLVWAARGLTLARRARGSAVTWGCAYDHPSSRSQYTASSYASSLLSVFGPISGSRVVRSAGALHTHPFEPVLDSLGRPLWRRLVEAATHLRTLQSGGMRWYLLYVILCLLGLLLYLRIRAPQ
jgi:NADH:ubiquinone oxidoreductase subunit 5 (subunit L)/multisubunit Na+/H+ antiporter MnhA subunit